MWLLLYLHPWLLAMASYEQAHTKRHQMPAILSTLLASFGQGLYLYGLQHKSLKAVGPEGAQWA